MTPFLRDGAHLRYEDVGAGPPVLFQHGLGGDAGQVAEVFPDAPPRRRITLECRGQGGSELGPAARLSIATFADDLEALAQALGLGGLTVGGISMGAAIALRLAVRRPERVRALILARPAWVTAAAPGNMQPYALVGELMARLPAEEARRRFEASETAAVLARQAPDNLASLRGFFARPEPAAFGRLLTAIAADGPGVAEEEVRRIAVPTLVIGHGRDQAHPLLSAEALAALIPGARLRVITPKAEDRAAHVREFRAALAEFLGRGGVSGALAVAEIGGTSVKIGFAAAGAPLAFARTWPTALVRTADPAGALAALLRTAGAEAGVSAVRVVATVPGFIDRDGDTVLRTANIPELDGLRLASGLSAALGLPVTLERDVVLQLLGESVAGAVAGEREVLAVYLGTGIGAAYLGAQGIFRGGGWALELGHLPVAAGKGEGPPPRVESVGSGAALAELAAAHGVPVGQLFRAPDARLIAALDGVLWHQALAIAAAATLFSPRIILIGGGIPEMEGFPRETLIRRIGVSLPDPYRPRPPEIRRARLGWKAAIHGALLLAGD